MENIAFHHRNNHFAATALDDDGTIAMRRWFLHESEATAWARARARFYPSVTVAAAGDVR